MSRADFCNIKVSVPWRSTKHFRDLRIWLIDNIHSDYYDFSGVDSPGNVENRVFWFARKQDAMLFALRWS